MPRRDSKYEPKVREEGGGGGGPLPRRGGGGARLGWMGRVGLWLAGIVALLFALELMLSIAVLVGPLASTLQETSAALHQVNVAGMVVNADLQMGSMEINTNALNMVTAAPGAAPVAASAEPVRATRARRGGKGEKGRPRPREGGGEGRAEGAAEVGPDPGGVGGEGSGPDPGLEPEARAMAVIPAVREGGAADEAEAVAEASSAFVAWCRSAPCAQKGAFANRCQEVEELLLTGENPDGSPRLPLPPTFCEAMVTLNDNGCLCDPAYAEVPGADEMLNFVHILGPMCSFQAQAPGVPGSC